MHWIGSRKNRDKHLNRGAFIYPHSVFCWCESRLHLEQKVSVRKWSLVWSFS